jgi:hypothetical protein
MSLNGLDLKKVYYYAICIMAFFVLMWGTVDLVSSSAGLLNIGATAASLVCPPGESGVPSEKGEQLFDSYYQKKMLMDRFWDSLARMLVSGIIFAYCRVTVNKLEKQS